MHNAKRLVCCSVTQEIKTLANSKTPQSITSPVIMMWQSKRFEIK